MTELKAKPQEYDRTKYFSSTSPIFGVSKLVKITLEILRRNVSHAVKQSFPLYIAEYMVKNGFFYHIISGYAQSIQDDNYKYIKSVFRPR